MSIGPVETFLAEDVDEITTIDEEEQKMLLDDDNDQDDPDDRSDQVDSKIVICRYWNDDQELTTTIDTVNGLSKEKIINFLHPKNPFILETLYCYLRNAFINQGVMFHLAKEIIQCKLTTGMMIEGEIKQFNVKAFRKHPELVYEFDNQLVFHIYNMTIPFFVRKKHGRYSREIYERLYEEHLWEKPTIPLLSERIFKSWMPDDRTSEQRQLAIRTVNSEMKAITYAVARHGHANQRKQEETGSANAEELSEEETRPQMRNKRRRRPMMRSQSQPESCPEHKKVRKMSQSWVNQVPSIRKGSLSSRPPSTSMESQPGSANGRVTKRLASSSTRGIIRVPSKSPRLISSASSARSNGKKGNASTSKNSKKN